MDRSMRNDVRAACGNLATAPALWRISDNRCRLRSLCDRFLIPLCRRAHWILCRRSGRKAATSSGVNPPPPGIGDTDGSPDCEQPAVRRNPW
jgi:hypothetical protein